MCPEAASSPKDKVTGLKESDEQQQTKAVDESPNNTNESAEELPELTKSLNDVDIGT